ncbi:hypothetical protein P152DRAFT_228311 [Eremomyces bilateralis CBS 781.70]|uniref:PARP catalytic domain-containing protein n=1 Tax=Eremomyces bilateralis CBS 781.70 TaxID=1392243 RepID=A0A6G1FRE2_9PEZI|nr:uncharacterized protein P152DRAFT_228311 [Eremomyces bilateralis CBS 781.70]KAF1808251.1 hypothetical protein P152DRAFT_228311 [Eremomyces bilateralis CBS 781.70]
MKWRPQALLTRNDVSSSRRRWQQQVEAFSELAEYLTNGHPHPKSSWVEALRVSTAGVASETSIGDERDNLLRDLINDHVEKSPSTRDIAVLSCFSAFSPFLASMYLLALKDLTAERYLRCVGIAYQLRPAIVGEEEIRVVRALLVLLSSQQRHLDWIRQLTEALIARIVTKFITNDIIWAVLAISSTRSRVEREVPHFIQQRCFATLYNTCSWLQDINEETVGNEVLQLLDDFFPSWHLLKIWRPKLERIREWEHADLDDEQRVKLLHIYDLDGPDMVARAHESLQLLEPTCYERLYVRPQDLATLDRVLDILYQAHCVGRAAIDLFIHTCIEPSPDVDGMALLELGVATRDNGLCQALVCLLKNSHQHSTLEDRIVFVITTLTNLTYAVFERTSTITPHGIADLTTDTLKQAQDVFRGQLLDGLTGEYVGMLIYDLGSAICRARWVHEYVPSGVIKRFSRIPPRDSVEAIFHHVQETGNRDGFRFKSFLESIIGGLEISTGKQFTLDEIQKEVQFWRTSPDTSRADFARIIGRVKSLEYAWYTECLSVMLVEVDLYVDEMRHLLQAGNIQSVQNFAKYIKERRHLNQLENPCWLLLLTALIQEQGDGYLEKVAKSIELDQWQTYVLDLKNLIDPVRSHLPISGTGLTQEQLQWWDKVTQPPNAVDFILESQFGRREFVWIYFPSNQAHFGQLLDIFQNRVNRTQLTRQILAHIGHDGSQVELVLNCLLAIQKVTVRGRQVCESVLVRLRDGWPPEGLNGLINAWRHLPENSSQDSEAFLCIQNLLFPNGSVLPTPFLIRATVTRLLGAHDSLIRRARDLETLRVRLRRQEPGRADRLLDRIGVESPRGGRSINENLNGNLTEAVETILDGHGEYEISFPLTTLGDLQRRARGIPAHARILIVRLCLQSKRGTDLAARFCIHYHPQDDDLAHHEVWDSPEVRPTQWLCNKPMDLFTCTIAVQVHGFLLNTLSTGQTILKDIHSLVENLINQSPHSCVLCSRSLSVKLWKPTSCSQRCSTNLRKASLEVQLHNLIVDPLAVDLLLTSIYAAATDTAPIDLLPDCPLLPSRLRSIIDSLPPLATLQTADDLYTAIHLSSNDGYGKDREDLLLWMCLKFRGFMLSVPDGFRVPSMGHSKQFILLNSHYEREVQYQAQTGASLNSNIAFHGTTASRLFSILANGLRIMHGRAILHGSTYGSGIYLGDDQRTSIHFSGSTGQSWRHSALNNLNVMLGCELAAYAPSPHGKVHLVTDEKRVLVRYVFLLPPNYVCPPRRHVEPAMQVACAMLRSGINH